MDPVTVGIVGILGLSLLLVSGMRIAYATALCGLLGLWALRGYEPAAGMAGLMPYAESSHYSLLVLPLFVLMGYLAHHAGITRNIYWTARQWLGHLPGGLAIATIFGCAGFAAACGASTASTAVMGRVSLPELKRYGYDEKVAAGCVAAGGTLATMIPPSVIMVIYGFIAEQSIGALLLAGILPGLLQAITYSVMLYIRFRINPALGPSISGIGWADRIKSLGGTWGMFVLIFIVLGGIYTGFATPTEAAGIGGLGALLMALPRMRRGDLTTALLETARTTAMIFAIIIGVLIFVRFLAFSGMPGALLDTVLNLDMNRYVELIAILALYLVLGMFLDGIGMLLLTIPIVLPAVTALGFNPIFFGVLVVRMIEIGLITPPVGLNAFVLKGVAPDIPIGNIFRGCGWFVAVDLTNVAILIMFPGII
ncbi:MAG: TRAP transporter large permease, partial [Burkholderiales bacterium]